MRFTRIPVVAAVAAAAAVVAFASNPARAQSIAGLSDEQLVEAALHLRHGLAPIGGPDAQDVVGRIEADPTVFIPLLVPSTTVGVLRSAGDAEAAERRATNALGILVSACGPGGADAAAGAVQSWLAERDLEKSSFRQMSDAFATTTNQTERSALLSERAYVGVLTAAVRHGVAAFTAAKDGRLRDTVVARLTNDPDLAWAYVDYLDVVAPDDATVSEAESQLYDTTSWPALKDRIAPRVTAYRESLTPPRSGAFGWVWASAPASASYTPSSTYAKNSAGGAVTITRSGTGAYAVHFAGLGGSGGNVQVTAYGATSTTYKAGGWGGSPDLVVYVYCSGDDGARVDSNYTVLFTREALDHAPADAGSTAYLWAQSATTASYTASSSYSYNDTGGINTIARTSTGVYVAHLPGISWAGSAQVTAYGSDASRCRVSGWGASGDGTSVSVACFSPSGAAADSRFTLSYVKGRLPGIKDDGTANRGGYAWASSPTSASYTPSTTYQLDTLTDPPSTSIVIRRTGTGSYAVDIPRSVAFGSSDTVQVVAYGGNATHCKVSSWSRASDASHAYVRCYAPGGASVDGRFDVLYLTDAP